MQEGWKQNFRPFCSGEQGRIVERACVWIPALSYIGFSAVWPWANALSSSNLNFWSVNCRKEYLLHWVVTRTHLRFREMSAVQYLAWSKHFLQSWLLLEVDQGVSTLSEASGQVPHYLTAATVILFGGHCSRITEWSFLFGRNLWSCWTQSRACIPSHQNRWPKGLGRSQGLQPQKKKSLCPLQGQGGIFSFGVFINS